MISFQTLALTTLLLVGCSHEPSLKETLQWMHDFLPEHAGDFSLLQESTWRTSYTMESKGCEVTITDFEERKNSPTLHDYKEVFQLSLSDIDPNTVKADKQSSLTFVEAATRDKRTLIHEWEDGKDYPQWRLHLSFRDPDDATRFAKAMKHAVERCGGKPSVF